MHHRGVHRRRSAHTCAVVLNKLNPGTVFKIAAGFLAIPFMGCASVGVQDLARAQEDLSAAVQANQNLMQKSQEDFAQKRDLLATLGRANPPGFKAAQPRLRAHLDAMGKALQEMAEPRKVLSEASGQVAALAYTRKTLSPNDREYARFDESMKASRSASAQINSAVTAFSKASYAFSDEIKAANLVETLSLGQFHQQAEHSIRTAQSHIENMRAELEHAEKFLNGDGGRLPASDRSLLEKHFAKMNDSAQNYSNKAGHLAEIQRDISFHAANAEDISSPDPNFPTVKALTNQFTVQAADLQQIYEQFQSASERFRKRN